MTSLELSTELNGRDADDKFTRYVVKISKENKLVIVTAIGRDTVFFNGAITEEFDLFKGGAIYLIKEGNEYVAYTKQSDKGDRKKIEAFYESSRIFQWSFRTLIPHSTFDVKKGDKNFCKAIVFSLEDV